MLICLGGQAASLERLSLLQRPLSAEVCGLISGISARVLVRVAAMLVLCALITVFAVCLEIRHGDAPGWLVLLSRWLFRVFSTVYTF